LNRLAAVVDNRLPVNQNTTQYAYDAASNLATVTLPNGLTSTFAYDDLNRLKTVSLTKESMLASYNYTLGPKGNRTGTTELSGRMVSWGYDGIYRLTNETISLDPHSKDGGVDYGLDPVGNRLSVASSLLGVASGTSMFDANDRLSTETYDNTGNTLTSRGKGFAYSFDHRLKSMNNGAVTLTYDGDGNRVMRISAGTATQYLVDDRNPTGYAQVVDEVVNGAVQRTYSYGKSRIGLNQSINGAWRPTFYGYDGFGTVRLLTDSAGSVTDTFDYTAWGSLANSTGTTPNSYFYRGEQFDADLGLYYLRARYYDPVNGRFITRDPQAGKRLNPHTFHKYLYGGANPVGRRDPSGLSDQVEYTGLTARIGKIALTLGRSVDEIKKAIHAVKRVADFEGNPDVLIDLATGEVYPQTVLGEIGDSIGNIFDFLP